MWEDTGKRPRLLPLDKFTPGRYLKASSLEVTRDLRNCQTLMESWPQSLPRQKRQRNDTEAAQDLASFLVATEQEVHRRRLVVVFACARSTEFKRRKLGLIGSEGRPGTTRDRTAARVGGIQAC